MTLSGALTEDSGAILAFVQERAVGTASGSSVFGRSARGGRMLKALLVLLVGTNELAARLVRAFQRRFI
jgi:hypothetical protein